MGKNIGKSISKSLSDKQSQKRLKNDKQPATDPLKTTSKEVIQKTAEAPGDFIGNKFANRITKVSRSSPQNNSETFKNEHDKEVPKGRPVSPEKIQKNIDDQRLI